MRMRRFICHPQQVGFGRFACKLGSISLKAGNLSQNVLCQSLFFSVLRAAARFSKLSMCLGDLFLFLVVHSKMVLEGWIVMFFQSVKLHLIAGQDVTAQFVLYPSPRVRSFGVSGLLLSRNLRP